MWSPPIPTTVKFGINSSPPGRLKPALPTGTQGEEGIQHGIGVPPQLVDRPSTSGESRLSQKMSDYHSTTTDCGTTFDIVNYFPGTIYT